MRLPLRYVFGIAAAVILASGALVAQEKLTWQQQEEFLRKGRITKRTRINQGVTGTERLALTDGTFTHDAQRQAIDESKLSIQLGGRTVLNFKDYYGHNVAVWKLARLLGLDDMTPVSVERDHAAFTWFVDDVRLDENKRLADNVQPPDRDAWRREWDTMQAFDHLIYNWDRNGGNVLYDGQWRLWMVDHTRAFRLEKTLLPDKSLNRIDRKLLAAMKTLTEDQLREEFGRLISRDVVRSLLARRDLIVATIEAKGEAALFDRPARQRPAGVQADVQGLAFVGHHVADLERSIQFFEALDFTVAEAPGDWTVDEELNKLGSTPGAESRTAILKVQSSVSDVPFTLVLRQYRGIELRDWSQRNSWDLLGSHIDLTVDGSVSGLLDKLEARNMLRMPEVNGLPNPRHQEGFRRYAFIQDPDGLVLEYFGKPVPRPGDPPAAPTVSNSSATPQNMDRLGKQAGFNHYAMNIVDPHKAQDFYVKVLGGDYPPLEGHTGGAQVVLHGWFPQAATNNNLRVELLAFEVNQGKTPPPIKFQDINANYAGFQVRNIETAYARAKEHGTITVSEGGIIGYDNGRAALIRDPDVGAFIMLWEPAQ